MRIPDLQCCVRVISGNCKVSFLDTVQCTGVPCTFSLRAIVNFGTHRPSSRAAWGHDSNTGMDNRRTESKYATF